MTNDAIGGDGMPSPPKASEVDKPPGKGAHDGNFSDQNPPGIGGEPSLGADGKLVKSRDNATREDRPPNGVTNVPTSVQELYEQEENEKEEKILRPMRTWISKKCPPPKPTKSHWQQVPRMTNNP
jgi:hypothetical protein